MPVGALRCAFIRRLKHALDHHAGSEETADQSQQTHIVSLSLAAREANGDFAIDEIQAFLLISQCVRCVFFWPGQAVREGLFTPETMDPRYAGKTRRRSSRRAFCRFGTSLLGSSPDLQSH